MRQNKIIGLTGGSGSGKTTVASVLKSLGAYIIDCDKIAHENMKKGGIAYDDLISAFGEGIIGPEGEINRKALGAIVFSDKEKLSLLNSIAHRYITEKVKELISGVSGVIVIDAPLLFEAGLDTLCSEIWVTNAPREVRISRIMERDNITRQQAESRLNNQREYPKGDVNITTNFEREEDMYNYVKELMG